MNTQSIATSAIMVQLNISMWTARKLDRKVSDEVNSSKSADKDASRVNKHLLAGSTELKAITKHAGMVRNWVYDNTLPWLDNGARIIPTGKFIDPAASTDFKRELEAHITEFNRLVTIFLSRYRSLISTQAFKLGDMFDINEYPSEDEIRKKFNMSVSYMPIPEAGDFRIDVHNEALDELQAQYKEMYEDKLNEAMADIRTRLLKGLKHIADRFADDTDGKRKVFRNDILEKFVDMLSTIKSLNVLRDETLDEIITDAQKAVKHIDVDDAKESDVVRRNTHKAMTDLLGRMGI